MIAPEGPRERQDAEQVDQAVALFQKNDLKSATKLLTDVASRAPAEYLREFETSDALYIKFWDVHEFTQFVTEKKVELKKKVYWLKSAYPRAFYYMGFLLVKVGVPEQALQLLDKGMLLEPHPMFWLEKGRALGLLKRGEEAIASYQHVLDMPGLVQTKLKAVAIRGIGFQLIEQGLLDAAEQTFQESLRLDPNNPVALNELQYIAQLRRTGKKNPPQLVASGSGKVVCAICGDPMNSGGKVHNIDGRIVWRCSKCAAQLPQTGPGSPALPTAGSGLDITMMPDSKPPRRWWQIWKK